MPFSELLAKYDPHKALTQEDVAEVAGVKVNTVKKWRQTGRGPRFFRVGQTARYLKSDVQVWLQSLYVRQNGRQRMPAAA